MKRSREENAISENSNDHHENNPSKISSSTIFNNTNNNNDSDTVGEPLSKKQIKSSSDASSPSSYYLLGLSYFDKTTDEDYLKSLELFMKGAEEEECAKCQHKIGYIYGCGLGVEEDHSKAMEWYLKSAKVLSKSMYNIGNGYIYGHGVEQDYTKAMEWYLKAAESNYSDAQVAIGSLYENGKGVEKDYTKAMEWYLKASENSDAQFYIGNLYENGLGVEQDYTKAMEWYLKAAESNYSDAQVAIGSLYDHGLGVEQDYTKTMEWYLKAAENNDSDAQVFIGSLYENGHGVEQDYTKSMEFYLKAAENDDADAQNAIGLLYKYGKGVEKDYTKAMEWYLKASENSKAQLHIGDLYENGLGVEQDYTKAMEWYLKAAESNYSDAQVAIGDLYENGLGVEQDYTKAMEWYLKAAENNDSDAQVAIGDLYENGHGVEQDYTKAMEWYLKVAENADAQNAIGLLYENGKGVEKDYSKAMEWYLKAFENGCNLHCNYIGYLYSVEKNYSKAMEWYLKAVEDGCDDPSTMRNIGKLYLKGRGVEKDFNKFLFWNAKSFNRNFKFIESPQDQFLADFISSEKNLTIIEDEMENQQVLIRFKERDFRILTKYLTKSKYLSTMLSANWKDCNEKDPENQIVLDMRLIENDIFLEATDHIQLFEIYLNRLTNDTSSEIDLDTKFKLIELAKYLDDETCISRIFNVSSVLVRLLILLRYEKVEPLHIAIASCFTTSSSFTINDLSDSIIEMLLNQSEILTSLAKKSLVEEFIKKFKKFPNSTNFGNKILHTTLSEEDNKQVLNFNNQEITFSLRFYEKKKNNILKIKCSHNLDDCFGKHAKYYIQLTNNNQENVAFWTEEYNSKNRKKLFKIFNRDFTLINLIIFPSELSN